MPRLNRGRRILLIAALGVTAGGASFGVYEHRQACLDGDAVAARAWGREALSRGDYGTALDGIGRYIQRFQVRGVAADDYVLFARARRHVELPNGNHLVEAMASLSTARAMDPRSAEAAADLLDLYLAVGYATESLALLDTLLEWTPDDRDLLDKKCDVFTRLRQFENALDTAREINRIAPDDLSGFAGTLAVRVASGAPAGEIDAWVGDAIAAHPADPRFELLRAALLVERGDFAGAAPVFDRLLAATAGMSDAKYVTLLVRHLDAAGRFDDSRRVLEGIGASGDVTLRRDLVRRLWYVEGLNDVVTRTADAGSDPETVALRALALIALGRRAEADPLRRDLAARADSAAKAWSAFVDFGFDGRSRTPRDDYDSMRAAAQAVPESAFIRYALGDAAAALGEGEMAIDAWSAAAARAAAWARPLREIAKVLLAMPGRESAAVVPAREALVRAPGDAETVATYIRAVTAAARDLNAARCAELIAVVKWVEEKAPEQAVELYPLQVGLIARSDTVAAERRLREILGAATRIGEATLLELARVAAASEIPLEASLLDRSESLHGVTPQLAMARAFARARADGPAAGLRAFDELMSRATKSGDPLEWEVVRATYLDGSRLPEAGPAWAALADAHPDDLQVQLRMLASTSAWNDRAATARAIERAHAQTGERGTTWRIARGRWLLSAEAPDAAEVVEAATILAAACRDAPRNSSAHLLLARALERMGNLPSAERQLQLASDSAVVDPRIELELSRLALLQGHTEQARARLDRALAAGDFTPDLSEAAAYLLAAQGDLVRSRELIEPLESAGRADRRGVLLLARLSESLGEYDRAIALSERLLKSPDAESVELAANLFEAVGRSADARDVLSRLDAIDMRPVERELVRARHAATWGSTADAVAALRRAVAAAPEDAAAWTHLLTFFISKGDSAALEELIADPISAGAERVRFLAGLAALRPAAMADPRLRPLLVAALNDIDARAALTAAMRTIVRDWGDIGQRAAAARAVRTLADANTRVLPLQVLAADVSAATGDLKGGIEIARRTMLQFPHAVEGAWQAAMMLASAGRWDEALAAGLAWKDRSGSGRRDLRADVFVAQAMLRLNRAPDAAAILEPRIAPALTHPSENESLLLTYCIASARSGRASLATEILAGLSRRSERWRLLPLVVEPGQWMATAADAETWLGLCAANVPANDATLRLALARTWGAAWDSSQSAEMLAAAREILRSLTAMPGSTAQAWHDAGLLEHKAGDLDAARRFYAGALQKDPAHPVTHNDLAMLLADSGHWQEAVEHATSATKIAPASAKYLDTLAYALRKGREYDRAAVALLEACRLEPANPMWRLGLAETLADAGKLDDADREATRIGQMASIGAEPQAALRDRLERLQTRLR